MTKLSNLM